MTFYRWKAKMAGQGFAISLFLIPLLLLAACGSTNTAPPPAQPSMAQQLLTQAAQKLNSAQTSHAIFNLSITQATSTGTTNTGTGTAKIEVWHEAPSKNRTVVLQSSLSQFTTGLITVTDGKQAWQYNPTQKLVYNGPVTPSTGTGTPTTGTGTPTAGTGTPTTSTSNLSQSLSPSQLLQSVLTQSDPTLTSSSATIDGHTVYDLHIVSQDKDDTGKPYTTGELYIDKTTELPVQATLDLRGPKVMLDIPMLTLNQAIPESTFVFTPPAGVKVLPFPKTTTNPGTTSATLAQAQQQAGYHLLSIPKSQSAYVLKDIKTQGASGSQIFILSYTMGNVTFAINESKLLAGHEHDSFDTEVKVRGMAGTSTDLGSGIMAIAWTENGVGITISGKLTQSELLAIAQSLS